MAENGSILLAIDKAVNRRGILPNSGGINQGGGLFCQCMMKARNIIAFTQASKNELYFSKTPFYLC
jgi:hypothetical protein